MPPQFGPMYGSKAVSEQALAEPLIDHLPADPVLIGDRNFGVFSVTWHAHSRGQGTGAADGTTCASADGRRTERRGPQSGVGTTREDRRSHPDPPAEARIEGRLIVTRPAHMKEDLYLFTTLTEPAEQVVAL